MQFDSNTAEMSERKWAEVFTQIIDFEVSLSNLHKVIKKCKFRQNHYKINNSCKSFPRRFHSDISRTSFSTQARNKKNKNDMRGNTTKNTAEKFKEIY